MRKIIQKGQGLTHGPMPAEIKQPRRLYQGQLPNNNQCQNKRNAKMADRIHHSPRSAHVDDCRNRGTPTRLFDHRNSQSQRKQHCTNGDLISSPRSQHVAQTSTKNRTGFKQRIGMAATTARKLSFSDGLLKECTVRPFPSPSVNLLKPRSLLNLSLDQISQDNVSSRTAKACEMTRQADPEPSNQSPRPVTGSGKLSAIDEIDELFRNSSRFVASRRQSVVSQKDTKNQQPASPREEVPAGISDTANPLRNPREEEQPTTVTVTPPLMCADKRRARPELAERPSARKPHLYLQELQEPFERLRISQKESGTADPNAPYASHDQELAAQGENYHIPTHQQKNKRTNAINTAYYKGFRGLHNQHHLVLEQAAQISGHKTKSHLPDDFVHVKNFKNLDTMHSNIREVSPDNQALGRNAERGYFEQAATSGREQKERRVSDEQIAEHQPDAGDPNASEGSGSEFLPQFSQNQDSNSEIEPRGGHDGEWIQKDMKKNHNEGQDSAIADLDSMMMTDSIDQIAEVTPNNIIYNQCQHGQQGHNRCPGESRGLNCSKASHGSKKKQNNQFSNQIFIQYKQEKEEQLNKAAQQSMEQRSNYASRPRVSSLMRTHHKDFSGERLENDIQNQYQNNNQLNYTSQQQEGQHAVPQHWAQNINPFQSQFTPVGATEAILEGQHMVGSQSAAFTGGLDHAPCAIATRFFGQNLQEFQQQSTQLPDYQDENIDEELVSFKNAIQKFNSLSQKIQQQQSQHMSIIQRVMEEDVTTDGQQLLNPIGFRPLNPFQVGPSFLPSGMPQLTLPAMDQTRAASVGVGDVGQASGFTLQHSAVAPSSATPILPSFLQKKPSPKDNLSGPQNPLARLSKEIQLQQNSQNLYDQIQLLAQQLKSSQQMMPVGESAQIEAALGSRRAMEMAQNSTSLPQGFNARVQQSKIQQQFMDYTLPNLQQINLTQGAKPFIDSSGSANFNQMQIQMASQEQERNLAMNSSMIVPLNDPTNSNNFNNMDLRPAQVPEDDDDVICISKNKNLIKKRSFGELQRRSQHESQGFGTSGSIDQCKSEQKSTRRRNRNKIAKSDHQLKSNQRLKEEGFNELDEQDQHSIDRNSGSLHLRSAKSLRKKNMQMGKSTFSAQRKFDEDEIIEVESTNQPQAMDQLNQIPLASQVVEGAEPAVTKQQSQPSALQKMIGPLTISERHQRILKFIYKKHNKNQAKKFTYECRKSVAEKRLRIKGRFVTKQQAFQILGLKENDIQSNEALQRLLEQHYNINNQTGTQIPYNNRMSQIMHYQLSKKQNTLLTQLQVESQQVSEDVRQGGNNGRSTIQVNSLIQNADGSNKTIKIRNFQALFDQAYSNQATINDMTVNEAFLTQNEVSSNSLSKDSSKNIENQNKGLQNGSAYKYPYSQALRNNSFSIPGSKMAMYNASCSSEYFSQQINILEMQQALRIQDEQNASATNSILENLVQPPFFKVERIDRDDNSNSDAQQPPPPGDASDPEASFNNKFENDSESLLNDDEQKLLDEF